MTFYPGVLWERGVLVPVICTWEEGLWFPWTNSGEEMTEKEESGRMSESFCFRGH